MELSLELLAARLEACDVDLEAHRGNIKALEYGLRAVIASHPKGRLSPWNYVSQNSFRQMTRRSERHWHPMHQCNDPLKTCSGVTFPEGDTDERKDGRRDQALDRPAQVGTGP